jgi:hypothetical protein
VGLQALQERETFWNDNGLADGPFGSTFMKIEGTERSIRPSTLSLEMSLELTNSCEADGGLASIART